MSPLPVSIGTSARQGTLPESEKPTTHSFPSDMGAWVTGSLWALQRTRERPGSGPSSRGPKESLDIVPGNLRLAERMPPGTCYTKSAIWESPRESASPRRGDALNPFETNGF